MEKGKKQPAIQKLSTHNHSVFLPLLVFSPTNDDYYQQTMISPYLQSFLFRPSLNSASFIKNFHFVGNQIAVFAIYE